MKPPLTYYGGKQRLSQTIITLIPKHNLYCEPFFGGGAVFFTKDPSNVEVINDTNGDLINFYTVVKTKFNKLQKEIQQTLHSRKLHKIAEIVLGYSELFTDVKRAWAIWVLANQSYVSKLDGTWGYDRTTNSTATRLQNKRKAFTMSYAERLEKTQLECTDALHVIKTRDSKESFFYCDPPYFNSNMGHYGGYTKEEYEKLLEMLSKIKGKFLLSSYPSEILAKYTRKHKWQTKKIDMPISAGSNPGGTKKRKVEVLTGNYVL